MTRRLLPPEEWPRLASTTGDLSHLWSQLPTDRACVLVVEEGDQIVGCWAFIPVLHAEGVWIRDDKRKGVSVARHLLYGLREVADALNATTVWTGSVDPMVDGLLQRHLNAQEPQFKSWVIPMIKGDS